jgi:two-component system, cell cycle sensor histidine kinase and response regulator CckA
MARPLHVLIVEDSQYDLELLLYELRRNGYEVDSACVDTRESMLAALEAKHWDAVISDFSLPSFNGMEALAIVQALGHDIPFILVSGTIGEELAVRAMVAGANDYVMKDRLARLGPAIDRELREAADRRARREAEQQLRLVSRAVEQTPTAVVITDYDGRIVYVNPRFSQVSGYTAAEAIGQNPRILKSGQTPAEVYTRLWSTLAAGQIWAGKFCNRAKDGRLFWERAIISPIRDSEGQVTHYVAVKEDITERREIQEQMMASQKMAELGLLSAGIAHEINSPLQIITGMAESLMGHLEKGDLDDARLRRGLDSISHSGWRVAEIVRAMLSFAHTSKKSFEANDLNAIVHETLVLTEHQLKSWSNVVVRTDLGPGLPPFNCDRNQIMQVVINLLSNARDAMPGGGEIKLRTRYNAETRHLVLQVADTGQGIPDEIRQKVFEPFFTTKELGKGTGLGLPLVLGIIQAHGGEIGFESQRNTGTTFTVRLPADLAPPSP